MKNSVPVLAPARIIPTLIAFALLYSQSMPLDAEASPSRRLASSNKNTTKNSAEPTIESEIIVGPFDLHQRYRSMEGPYTSQTFRVSDLAASKKVIVPESAIEFIESTQGAAPSMSGGGSSKPTEGIQGLVDTSNKKRALYWFKGLKLEVLDENDKPLPTAEFVCHLNLDVDPAFRDKVFPDGERTHSPRLVTLTQGQTEFFFPEGYAVPVAGDENWRLIFQAANRTTDKHRRVKHRLTMSFIKDADLVYPIKALGWYAPYVNVVVDKDSPEAAEAEHQMGPGCMSTAMGLTAPNSTAGSVFTDTQNRRVSAHWVIPPGSHKYTSPITEARDPGFASKDRTIHAVWTHVHPLCTNASLQTCDGKNQENIFSVGCKTNVDKGLEIAAIDTISSQKGIKLPAGKQYQVVAEYNNTTDKPQDSMVVLGMFFADNTFARPDWFLCNENGAFCGIAPVKTATEADSNIALASVSTKSATSYMPPFPLFDTKLDGPLLTSPKAVEVITTMGKLHLELDPAMAPMHATSQYRLMLAGVFDGTEFYRYEPNFVLQLNSAETKVPGQHALTPTQTKMLRRLPLEVTASKLPLNHKKWMLSMARYDDNDSASSSFSIMLGDAPHLDDKYTLFGRLIPDEETLATMKHITEDWAKAHPYIKQIKDFTPAK